MATGFKGHRLFSKRQLNRSSREEI